MEVNFTPVNMTAQRTIQGVKHISGAIMGAPVAFVLSVALIVAGWLFYIWLLMSVSASPSNTRSTLHVAVLFFFIYIQIYAPVLCGAYLMYKRAYQLSMMGFWHNLSAVNFWADMLRNALFIVLFACFFVYLAPLGLGEKEVSPSSNVTIPYWLIAGLMMFGFSLSVYLLVGLNNIKHITLRTGLPSVDVRAYLQMAKQKNPKLMPVTVLLSAFIMTLLALIKMSVLWQSVGWSVVQLTVAMFWIYVLFGNSFPTKKPVKQKQLKPVASSS